MIETMFHKIRQAVKEGRPLIHCITNPISINQCANAVLAVGARPIMAEHPKEVEEITATAQALVLNLGNITDVRMEAMPLSAREAGKRCIPVVLDAVGVSCSGFRRRFACDLIKQARPAVLKGNYSEIFALYQESYRSAGVDAEAGLTEEAIGQAAAALSRKYGAVILASGKTDLVTDGKQLLRIRNGSVQLSAVTGTGCMLGALCGCFLAGARAVCQNMVGDGDLAAAAAACAVLGICGELSETDRGSGSFLVQLLDGLSTLSDEVLQKRLDMEEQELA